MGLPQALLTILCGLLLPSLALGAAARAPAQGQADARLQMLVQQLTAEKTALNAEKSRLQKELDELKDEVDKLKKGSAKTNKSLKATKTTLAVAEQRSEALENQNGELRRRFDLLADRFRELQETLATVESQRNEMTSMAADYDERVVVCERNNENLYTIVNELTDAYASKGFLRSLREREPFLKLKRTQVQNMLDEYQYLAEEMRLNYEAPEAEMSGVSAEERGP